MKTKALLSLLLLSFLVPAHAQSKKVSTPYQEFTVSTPEEFLQALGSNRTINIAANTTLNLSDVLDNEAACKKLGIKQVKEYEDLSAYKGVLCRSVFDGNELVIKDVKKLTIRGEYNTQIEVEPRYAYVLNLIDCSEILLENITIGHTATGYCEGGVIGMGNSTDITIEACDLYGCGTYGIFANQCKRLLFSGSVIRDCSYGIIVLEQCERMRFEHSDFIRNQEFYLVDVEESTDVSFAGCRFWENEGELFSLGGPIRLDDCKVYHDLMRIGEETLVDDHHTTWDNSTGILLEPRGCGPDNGAFVPWERY